MAGDCAVVIPCVRGVSEKFRYIGNQYHLRTIFETSHALRSSLMKTRPGRDPLDSRHGVKSIYHVNVDRAASLKWADHWG